MIRSDNGLDPDRPVFLLRRHFEAGRVGGIRVDGVKYAVREGRWKYILDGGLDIREK